MPGVGTMARVLSFGAGASSNMQQWWCTAQYAAVVHCPICSGGALPNMQGAVGTPSSTDQLIDVRPHQDLSSALPIQRKEKEKTHSVFEGGQFSKSTGHTQHTFTCVRQQRRRLVRASWELGEM